ncbi:DUF3784 domain-containing protein [Rossellomorea marisflavi]|uniref:DUF3784 domain-containing protein n=1 Tax=Rossellomorea marisflavi TaxID=189381 RepID=UPI0007005B64|nr:DUF3784 domain-containing protein [Rossellomorea marisflavi]KQU63293.1 hypothetical protein ASG66_02445 [Bacillus sp. Leaf406]UKS66134.1 DUF3784 domain-containing protein [Rossellomorea marisflavi]
MLWGTLVGCLFASLFLFGSAYLIWYKKDLTFIAGYDEKKFKGDKDRLARAYGIFCLVSGVLTVLLPFALAIIGSYAEAIFGIWLTVGVVMLAFYSQSLNAKSSGS